MFDLILNMPLVCQRIYPAKITCSKSTIEALEKGVKYVQS